MTKNIYQKLNDIQKEITTVLKTAKISITDSKSYNAVTHDHVAGLLHLPLANAGIFVQVSMDSCEIERLESQVTYKNNTTTKYSYMATVQMIVTFINSDDPKDFFATKQTACAFDSGDKAVGKAQSMAVKYAYLKNLNLESMDDEELRNEAEFTPKEHVRTYNNKPPQYENRSVNYNNNKTQNNYNKNTISDETLKQYSDTLAKHHDKSILQNTNKDFQLVNNTIDEIRVLMGKLTNGQSMDEKIVSMGFLLGVNSFKDLSKKNLKEYTLLKIIVK